MAILARRVREDPLTSVPGRSKARPASDLHNRAVKPFGPCAMEFDVMGCPSHTELVDEEAFGATTQWRRRRLMFGRAQSDSNFERTFLQTAGMAGSTQGSSQAPRGSDGLHPDIVAKCRQRNLHSSRSHLRSTAYPSGHRRRAMTIHAHESK